jgi:signal peptidase I
VLGPRRKSRAADDREPSVSAEDQQPILVQYARSFFPIFLIVLLLRSFLVEPFRIPSGSMMPTLLIGDFILVNKFTYGIRLPVLNAKIIDMGTPQRGDVIVFRYPEDLTTPYIKRVIGVPGDRVTYFDKVLKINGEVIETKELGPYVGAGAGANFTDEIVLDEDLETTRHKILVNPQVHSREVDMIIPDRQYFVMGDNRDNSKDSRYWGTVPDENLIGRAFMIWMNWDGGVDWTRLGGVIH